MAAALARYQLTIVPIADAEISRWRTHATHITDPQLRQLALDKLANEDSNASSAAVFALLAPRATRRAVVELLTAWQILYDLLDAITEQPSPDPLTTALRTNTALPTSIDPNLDPAAVPDDDGGYLRTLTTTCRQRLWQLPAAATIAPIATAEARRSALAQSHTHAATLTSDLGPLRAWAEINPRDQHMAWWETAAAGISSLAVLALLAHAADPATGDDDALAIANAYGTVCALSTLLDSLVDVVPDEATGNLSYYNCYPTPTAAAVGMRSLAERAIDDTAALPKASIHHAIVDGLVAFYLAKLPARTRRLDQRAAASAVRRALGPGVVPALLLLSWRR